MIPLKVDDWVIDTTSNKPVGQIIGFTDYMDYYSIDLNTGGSYKPEWLKLWQPKEGEWCWKSTEFVRIDTIRNLNREDGLLTYTYSIPSRHETCISSFEPEPFIGELPSFLQNNSAKELQCTDL